MKNRALNPYIEAAKQESIDFDTIKLKRDLLIQTRSVSNLSYKVLFLAAIAVAIIISVSQALNNKKQLLVLQETRNLDTNEVYSSIITSYERE